MMSDLIARTVTLDSDIPMHLYMNVMYTVHLAPIWETCTAVLYTHLHVNLTVLNVTHVTVYIYIFIRYIMHLYEVVNIHAHTAEQNINDS